MLCRSCLIVLGFRRDTKLPKLQINIFHISADPFTDGSKIMVIHFLSLRSRRSKQGSSCKNQIFTLQIIIPVYQKILLLCTDTRNHSRCFRIAKQTHDTKSLLADRFHGTQKRCFRIQCFALIRTECGRNTKNHARCILAQECRRRNIPCGITTCFKGCTKPARRKRRSIRLTLNKLFAGKFHQHFPIHIRMRDKRIMLFSRNTGEGLKPVRIMGCTILNCPVLHGFCHHICCCRRKFTAAIHCLDYFFVNILWKAFPHGRTGKHPAAKKRLDIFHIIHCFPPYRLFSCP